MQFPSQPLFMKIWVLDISSLCVCVNVYAKFPLYFCYSCCAVNFIHQLNYFFYIFLCFVIVSGSHDTHIFRLTEPLSNEVLSILNYPVNLQQAENGQSFSVIFSL